MLFRSHGDFALDRAVELRGLRAGRGVERLRAGVVEPPVSDGLVREHEISVAGGLGRRARVSDESGQQERGEKAKGFHCNASG